MLWVSFSLKETKAQPLHRIGKYLYDEASAKDTVKPMRAEGFGKTNKKSIAHGFVPCL